LEIDRIVDVYMRESGVRKPSSCLPTALRSAIGAPVPRKITSWHARQGEARTKELMKDACLVGIQEGAQSAEAFLQNRDRAISIFDELKQIFDMFRMARRTNTQFGQKVRTLHIQARNMTRREIHTSLKNGNQIIMLGDQEGVPHAVHVGWNRKSYIDLARGEVIHIKGIRRASPLVLEVRKK